MGVHVAMHGRLVRVGSHGRSVGIVGFIDWPVVCQAAVAVAGIVRMDGQPLLACSFLRAVAFEAIVMGMSNGHFGGGGLRGVCMPGLAR